MTSLKQDFSVIQGAHSTTFSTPPVDGNLTIPELFAFHAVHSSTHKLFVYADGVDLGFVDYATAFRAQVATARIIKAAFDLGADLYSVGTSRPVFGILAITDSVTYGTLLLGIQQTGAVPFPISVRNSPVAIAHLLRSMNVRQIFVSEDHAMSALASNTVNLLSNDGYRVALLEIPRFETLDKDVTPSSTGFQIAPFSLDATVLILHSSGTSAFPKAIQLTNRTWLSFGAAYYYGEVDVCGIRLGAHAAPMFHVMGASLLVFAACTGMELAVFKPMRPPIVLDAPTFFKEVIESRSEWVVSVPSLIEEWWKDATKVAMIASRVRRIAYGGAALDNQVGDDIHSRGIILDCWYGTTETGPLHMMVDTGNARPTEWEYFRLPSSKFAIVKLVPQNNQEGLFEVFLMAGQHFSPSVFNVTVDGDPGFAVGDLIQEHPLCKGYFKFHGRSDEQIVLSTGEKTNPVPLERILMQDRNIRLAVLFGWGRLNNGVLVQPAHPFHLCDSERLSEFRNLIWPTVSAMNRYAPAHSHLLKEMILVTRPDKPLELTGKGSVRRNTCLATYEEEIETAYAKLESSSHAGPEPPAVWTSESTSKFIHAVVGTIMSQTVDEHDDLFSLGCDSLRATYIRNNIIRALRASPSALSLACRVPQNLVYQNASIYALHGYLLALVNGGSIQPQDRGLAHKAREMDRMAAKYSAGFHSLRSAAIATSSEPPLEIVLLTGTTGRLGSHLLAQLIPDPKVHHIYALNRAAVDNASSEAVLKRMLASFVFWGLDPALLNDSKVTFLVGDYSEKNLGLEGGTYTKLESLVTTIVHNAWHANFNIALSGFEPLIVGVRHLVDLAARASGPGGARLIFVSSVSVLHGVIASDFAPEMPIRDAALAAGIGYTESKWVAETILLRAHKALGLRVTIVRVGQLAGDTRLGGWGKQEWVGAIARLGQVVQALPDRDENIFWVPVDVAATALIDITRADDLIFNLVAPIPSDWHTVFGTFAAHLGIPLVKYDEWLARVSALTDTIKGEDDAQLLALVDFFKTGYVGGINHIISTRACAASPALATMSRLEEKDALLYLSFWEKIGHLRAQAN